MTDVKFDVFKWNSFVKYEQLLELGKWVKVQFLIRAHKNGLHDLQNKQL